MCARPHLHEFLEGDRMVSSADPCSYPRLLLAAYLYYDICIWSQTSWIWLETKLAELGIVGHDRPYKVCLRSGLFGYHLPNFNA